MVENKDIDKNDIDKADKKVIAKQVTGKAAEPEIGGWRKLVNENIRLVAIALIIAITVRLFIAEPRFIPSPSMVPTLAVGDRLLVEKVSYRFHEPHRGDIVVFEPPPQLQEYGYTASQAFIKRVVGLPGQTVEITQGRVYVDGQPLTEDYILEAPAYEMPAVEVPADSLFVMGDNRNDSNDSHVWGFLPMQNVIGRAALRFWPIDKLGTASLSKDSKLKDLAFKTRDSAAAQRPPSRLAAIDSVNRLDLRKVQLFDSERSPGPKMRRYQELLSALAQLPY
ncbi:signal peptidase I, putative [Synechococcus sp. PCC 7335]|nr:signal peptidase I, putative [Synechococcus sp. PCC 7335]